MKNTTRFACLILSACLVLFSLTGCSGLDEDTKSVIAAIENIGTVTIGSENDINEAQRLYNCLNDEQKSKVNNHDTLTSAVGELDKLKKSIEIVENLINSIGDVTLDSEGLIAEARAAYDQLNIDQRKMVLSYNVLTIAEGMLASLKEEERQRELTVNVGDTVISTDWSITLTNAYTSNTLSSSESRTAWEISDGYAFLILEFDVTCLNSTKPTIDDDAITNILATVNGNTYSNWEYKYVSSELWLYIRHTYLEANLPLHIYVYGNIPSANMNDKITVNLKIDGQEKVISIN